MDNWYATQLMAKIRQRELEAEAARLSLIQQARQARTGREDLWKAAARRCLMRLGRALETLGQGLQKRYQKC